MSYELPEDVEGPLAVWCSKCAQGDHPEDARQCPESGDWTCGACVRAEYAYREALYGNRRPEPTPAQYREQMIDAGRGHLLRGDE